MVDNVDNYPIDNLHPKCGLKSFSWYKIKRYGEQIHCKQRVECPPQIKKKKKGNVIRSKLITFYPNQDQKITLLKWMEIYRIVYNMTVKFINQVKFLSFIDMRKVIKSKFLTHFKLRIKKSRIPSHTIDKAIKEAVSMFKSCFTNLRVGNIKHFRVRYRKKDCPRQVLTM